MEILLKIIMWLLIVAVFIANIYLTIKLLIILHENDWDIDDNKNKELPSSLFWIILCPFIGTPLLLFMFLYIIWHKEEIEKEGTDMYKLFNT